MSNVKIAESIIAVPYILGIVFIVLKVCKLISWSWLWILSPFWIPVAIIVCSLILFAILIAFSSLKHLIK